MEKTYQRVQYGGPQILSAWQMASLEVAALRLGVQCQSCAGEQTSSVDVQGSDEGGVA